jgi:glycosyltransferase involved in cell wall biosynthesis
MKVGVFEMGGAGWTGGLTYLRNLGHSVRESIPDQLNLYLIHKHTDPPVSAEHISACFDGVIEVRPIGGTGRSPAELARKVIAVLAGGDIINTRRFEKTLVEAGIEVVFGMGLNGKYRLPSVGWFPDFQHIDLPQFFSQKEKTMRNLLVSRMAQNCDRIVFSSSHARNCFLRLHPTQADKARVLHFAAHLPAGVLTTDPGYLLPKLGLPEKFIYLPNQLWKHKDHLTAFKAVKILADRNVPVCLVCSGNLNEQKAPEYKQEVFDYVRQNNLADRIFILGMVDFDDVYALIRQSCCVLNPSLYEGWSTTVEETKTIGKPMILSDLEVHREQDPPRTEYFEPQNAEALAAAMARAWEACPAGPNAGMEATAAQDHLKRSRNFAQTFADVCREAVAERKS